MYRGLRVVVLAPCHNEAPKIGTVVRRVRACAIADAVWVIDDGSTDGSGAVAEAQGAVVLPMDCHGGVGAALRFGFIRAMGSFDVVVVIAGNDKDEPLEIARLLEPIAEGRADFVQGSRYLKGGRAEGAMPLYRRLATRLHPWLFSLVAGRRVTESTNGFRAMRSEVLGDPRLGLDRAGLEGYELEPFLYARVIQLGYRTAEVPVTKTYPQRGSYTKMRPWTDWWAMLRPLWWAYFCSL